jgi:hypothetical protein
MSRPRLSPLTRTCEGCGQEFDLPSKKPQKKFCTHKCYMASRGPEQWAAMLANPPTPERRSRVGNGGYRPTADVIARISVTLKGRVFPHMHRSHSPETRAKMRAAKLGKAAPHRAGPLSPFWKGGVTRQNIEIRAYAYQTIEYKRWRRAVLARDDHKCVLCGSEKNLEVDHIQRWIDHPNLRFDINNGRTLCQPCHQRTPTYGGRYHAVDRTRKDTEA